jgi:hypothetical protein
MLGVKRVKLYLEQAQAEVMTLLAEPRVGCKELVGNYQPREMIALDRMRLTDPLERNRDSSQAGAQVPGAEAEFTSSSGEVRASSVHAKKELGDEER